MQEEERLPSDEEVAIADAELGGEDAGGTAAPQTESQERVPAVAPSRRPAPAAPIEDLDLPEPLQKKFGAAKVSELFQKAADGEATKADLRQLYAYARKLEGELTAAQAQRAQTPAAGQGKPKPEDWLMSPEYFALMKSDPQEFKRQYIAAMRELARQDPKEIEKQVQQGVQQGLQPVAEAEQARQVQAFKSHLTERYAELFVKDPRFAPAHDGKPAGELFAAMDKIYSANQHRLELWAWQDPRFDPFDYCAKQVLGEMAMLGQKAAENKLQQFRNRSGSARPTTGATTRPKTAGGSALDDFEEVAAERPDLAEGVDQALMAKLAQQMERAGL